MWSKPLLTSGHGIDFRWEYKQNKWSNSLLEVVLSNDMYYFQYKQAKDRLTLMYDV